MIQYLENSNCNPIVHQIETKAVKESLKKGHALTTSVCPQHSLLPSSGPIHVFVAGFLCASLLVWKGCPFHLLFYDPAIVKSCKAVIVINGSANTLH